MVRNMRSSAPGENRLLGNLPNKALTGIRGECDLIELTKGDAIYEPPERIREVYFPTRSVISLIANAAGHASLEVALVGDEGMIEIPLLLGADSKPLRALVQRSGTAWRIKAETFRRMTGTHRDFRHALNKYVLLRLAQVAQNAVCANPHQVEACLARRILMMQDRFHSNELPATHESLAKMLGVRCSSVTVIAGTFQKRSLIQYSRGVLTVLDRKALETLSCGCSWMAEG
jgi:CRP-like cAMP-binding protein